MAQSKMWIEMAQSKMWIEMAQLKGEDEMVQIEMGGKDGCDEFFSVYLGGSLAGWEKESFSSCAEQGKPRTETVWMTYSAGKQMTIYAMGVVG